jgi:hypothetical protein
MTNVHVKQVIKFKLLTDQPSWFLKCLCTINEGPYTFYGYGETKEEAFEACKRNRSIFLPGDVSAKPTIEEFLDAC